MENPVEELPAAPCYQHTDFWPGQFEEIVDSLLLLPDIIVCPAAQKHIIQASHNNFVAKVME
jgi:hypothetical protein